MGPVLIRAVMMALGITLLACHRKAQELPNSIQAEPSMAAREITLLVPDAFEGVLKIVKDSERGAQLRLRGNRLEIPFTSEGICTVSSFEHLEEWHTLHAQYPSGKVLKIDPEEELESGEKALWIIGKLGGTKYPRETMIYLVCTKADKSRLSSTLR